MVVAAAAPLTVIAGTVPLGVAAGNGAAFPTTFALCCAILLLFAVGFCAMSRHVPERRRVLRLRRSAGSAGRPAWARRSSRWSPTPPCSSPCTATSARCIDGLVQHWGGPALPWWLWSLVVLAVVGDAGLPAHRAVRPGAGRAADRRGGDRAGVRRGRRSGAAAARRRACRRRCCSPSQVVSGSLGIAIMFAIASFIGFEATAVFRDEARDPQRTIPRATYLALVLIGVFYTLSSWAVVSAWGDAAAVAAGQGRPRQHDHHDDHERARARRRRHRPGAADDQPVRRDPVVPQRAGPLLLRARQLRRAARRVRAQPPAAHLAARRVADPDGHRAGVRRRCSRSPGWTR